MADENDIDIESKSKVFAEYVHNQQRSNEFASIALNLQKQILGNEKERNKLLERIKNSERIVIDFVEARQKIENQITQNLSTQINRQKLIEIAEKNIGDMARTGVDVNDKLVKNAMRRLDTLKLFQEADRRLLIKLKDELKYKEDLVDLAKEELITDERKLKNKDLQINSLKKILNNLEKTLKIKEIASDISGSLTKGVFGPLQNIMSKLPLGDTIYKHMFGGIEEQFGRNIKAVGIKFMRSLQQGVPLTQALSKGLQGVGGAAGEAGMAIARVVMANPWLLLIALIVMAAKRFFEIDKAAEDFRRETGLTISQTKTLTKEAERLSSEFQRFGVDVEKAFKSISALSKTFSGNIKFAKDNAQFVALMAANLGVAEEDSAGVMKNFMGLGKMSAKTAQDLILWTKELSNKAGVSFSLVMKDVAGASDRTLAALRGNPEQLAKAAVMARKLGTSLEAISGSMDSVLNFQESLNKEMNLSTLLGKHVSLQALREASFRGDAVQYQKELTKQIEKFGDISGKTPFQIKAMSDALGMTVIELKNMSAQQKLQLDLQKEADDGNKEAIEELAKQKQYQDMLNKGADVGAKSAAERSKSLREQQEMQSQMNQLTNDLKQLLVSIGNILLPIIKIFIPILTKIGNFIAWILSLPMVPTILAIVTGIVTIAAYLGPIISAVTAIGSSLAWVGYLLYAIGAAIVAFVGWPVIIAAGIIALGTLIWKYLMPQAWKDKIIDGLKSVGSAIYEFIKYPFVAAYDWIMSFFGGSSPSEIGLSIVEGIKSIGGMLIDVLIFPWKTALEGIKTMGGILVDILVFPWKTAWNLIKKIPFVSKLFGGKSSDISVDVSKEAEAKSPMLDMVTTISNQLNQIVSLLQSAVISATTTPLSPITALGTNVPVTNVGGNILPGTKGSEEATLLRELIDLMKSGAISINLDGKKVSRELAFAVS